MALPNTIILRAAGTPLSGNMDPAALAIYDSADHALPQVFIIDSSGSIQQIDFDGPSGRVIEFTPAATSVLGPVRGLTAGAFGTASHPAPTYSAGTSLLGTMYRTRFTSGTGTNNPAGIAMPVSGSVTPSIWRGNAPGRGGFFISARFATTTGATSGSRGFCGLGNAIHAVNPQTLSSSIGMHFNDGDPISGNWYFGTNNGQALGERWDLGTGSIRSGDHVFDCYMWAPPNGDFIAAAVVNLSSGTVIFNQTITGSNLPDRETFHYFEIVKNAANSGVAQTCDIQRVFIWSSL